MATVYDYSTRKIERDFHFVKRGGACRLMDLPMRIGSERCMKCKNNNGVIYGYEYGGDIGFVMCKHEAMKDSEGYFAAAKHFYEKFEERALSALCY